MYFDFSDYECDSFCLIIELFIMFLKLKYIKFKIVIILISMENCIWIWVDVEFWEEKVEWGGGVFEIC